MDAHPSPNSESHKLIGEVVEGLREYQMLLVDSAGKVSDAEVARKLYHLADEHGELESQLCYFAGNDLNADPSLTSPFLNQIRSLGKRLKHFNDFTRSKLILCEIAQVEDRMIRRFHCLIEQISDLKWRRRLTRQLSRLLDIRADMGRLKDDTAANQRESMNPRLSSS